MTVADLVADGLVAAGVARIFTTGGAMGPLTDAVRARSLRFVEPRLPATAAVMAAVTGELGGAPGVLILSGVDATGADGGLQYAASARAPLLLISGGDADPGPALAPHLKAVVRVTREEAGAEILAALRAALQDPQGPVQVVLTPDVAAAGAKRSWSDQDLVVSGAAPAPEPAALDRAAEVLAAAERPVLVIGLRCRSGNAAPWLRALAETVPMPVLATPRARGVLPDPHPLMLGLVGAGNAVLARADLLVTIGLDRCEEIPAWPPGMPRLDLGTVTGDTLAPLGVVRVGGEVALIVEELAPRLRDHRRADWDVAELDRLKRAGRAVAVSTEVSLVRALTLAGTIATVDEGPLAQAIAAAWQAVGPNELLIGTGDPGQPFAPAAAVAAALARPGARAIAFVGAASLGSSEDAMQTADRLQASVLLIALGSGARLDGDELARALHRALASPGPHVIPV